MGCHVPSRALGALAVVAALVTTSGASHADEKKQCLSAADQGQQLRDEGKYRRAREAFTTCSRDACPSIVRSDCLRWLVELEAQSPSLVVGAKDERGMDLIDVSVTVDGILLTSKLDGKPIQVDPGEHEIHYETYGYPPVIQRIVVNAGAKSRLLDVQFAPRAPPTATNAMPSGPSDTSRRGHGIGVLPILFGSVAVLAFGSEAYFGITGVNDRKDLLSQPCGHTGTCSPSAIASIRRKFAVADVSLGVGVVSAALAIYFSLSARRGREAPPHALRFDVTPAAGGGVAGLSGRF